MLLYVIVLGCVVVGICAFWAVKIITEDFDDLDRKERSSAPPSWTIPFTPCRGSWRRLRPYVPLIIALVALAVGALLADVLSPYLPEF
jgi:nitrogen fixation-related uncharacterized protein